LELHNRNPFFSDQESEADSCLFSPGRRIPAIRAIIAADRMKSHSRYILL
jgi:hypothetical protein